jgi:glycosyltransferase involved in cell wall biosynthesis
MNASKNEERPAYSIVVPFYNEQENVTPLYFKIIEVMDTLAERYEMVFVDDGSRDDTYRILRAIHMNDERVTLVRLRRNFGQTAAMQAGFDFAQGDIVISMDGDLQHDPEEIPILIQKIKEGYDIASGWRVARRDAWLTRQLPSRVANWIMAKLTRLPLHDFGTTFKAYRREILAEIHLYGELHRFIPALASWAGAKITEVPITNIPRKNGKSNYGLGRTIRVLLDLINVKFLLDYSVRPLGFFGALGLVGMILGVTLNIFLLSKKMLLHQSIMLQNGPLLLLGIGLLVSGLQFLAIGLLGEILTRTYFESQKKPIYALREVKSMPLSLLNTENSTATLSVPRHERAVTGSDMLCPYPPDRPQGMRLPPDVQQQ